MVGSAGSGKKSLSSRYLTGFSRSFEKTLGVDIYIKEEVNPHGEEITFACWVCSPERRFQYYWNKFYRGALGAFILFDLTDRSSFEEIKFWEEVIHLRVADIPIVLIGNKSDLKNKRIIKFDEAMDYSKRSGLDGYIETSVKKNINISRAFQLLNESIYTYIKKKRIELESSEFEFD